MLTLSVLLPKIPLWCLVCALLYQFLFIFTYIYTSTVVLAIASYFLSRLLKPTSELRRTSEAFHALAQQSAKPALFTHDLPGLQRILLLAYYAFFNPTRGSTLFSLLLKCNISFCNFQVLGISPEWYIFYTTFSFVSHHTSFII